MEVDKKKLTKGNIYSKGAIRNFDRAGLNPEQVEDMIEQYFASDVAVKEITYYNQGKPITKECKLYTFPGLCLWLGFNSRDGYRAAMNNKGNPFNFALKKGYIRLQQYLEELTLHNANPAGSLFILKNMDYSDQQTINQNVTQVQKPEIHTQDKDSAKGIRKLFAEPKTGT